MHLQGLACWVSDVRACATLSSHLLFTLMQVALEFHRIRDSYPSFFQSQFGNKMWYTGKLSVYVFSLP